MTLTLTLPPDDAALFARIRHAGAFAIDEDVLRDALFRSARWFGLDPHHDRFALTYGGHRVEAEQASADTRYVYSARCTWNGPIQAVGKLPSGLPCCPQCRSPLFELPSELEWTKAAHAYEREGHTGYASFMTWMRGRCFRGSSRLLDAAQAYQKETGRAVTL